MEDENLIIPKLFSKTSAQFPDHVALQIKRDSQWLKITYQELETQSQRVATYLIKAGLKKGDCVSIILENRPEWPIIYLGIVWAGLTCVPIDAQLNAQELKNLILDCQAKFLFCSEQIFKEKIKAQRTELVSKIVLLDTKDAQEDDFIKFSDLEQIAIDLSIFPAVHPTDIASLIYTSGTTAIPKGVLLSHKNLCANFKSIEQLNVCCSSDNILSILPLHHTYAFMVTLMVPLCLGAKVTYLAGFKPQELADITKEAKVTMLVGVPQLFSLLYKSIFEKIKKIPFFLRPFIMPLIKKKTRAYFGPLRLLVSGGARLEPKVAGGLSKILGIKLIEGYGLTETSPVACFNPPQKIKFGSVGKPVPNVELKISHPDPAGIGEVLIKGPNVMQGYFKHPDLTSQVIKDGWFYSGDLGYLDKEGYLILTGREKEVIVLSSGKNIYPEELEEYYGSSPYVKEMCILSRKEERFGSAIEMLYAVVVPNLEYFKKNNVTDIRAKIRWELENLGKSLPSYKHIMGFSVTKEELPRTALKKLKRYQVQEKYLSEKLSQVEVKEAVFSQEDLRVLNQETSQKIMRYISQQLHKPVYLDSHLELDLGIDSLSRVELGLGLESLLKIKIPDNLLLASTVREVITNILNLLGSAPTLYKEEVTQKSWQQILSESPSGNILQKIRTGLSFLDILLTFIFKSVLLFILRIFWSLKIQGREFLPKQGPYLICPNHASYLDGFVVFSSLSLKNSMHTFFLGYSKIFDHPIVSWTVKVARLISIDTATHLTEAMQAVSFVARFNKIVCVFPEGRRSVDENIGEFKKGVGILIKGLNIPAIPVYIKGSHYSWPRGSLAPRIHPLKIIFGRPIPAEELIREGRKESVADDYEAIAKGLRKEVLKLVC